MYIFAAAVSSGATPFASNELSAAAPLCLLCHRERRERANVFDISLIKSGIFPCRTFTKVVLEKKSNENLHAYCAILLLQEHVHTTHACVLIHFSCTCRSKWVRAFIENTWWFSHFLLFSLTFSRFSSNRSDALTFHQKLPAVMVSTNEQKIACKSWLM